MIEGRMNGVAEAHHAQPLFAFPYSMSGAYPTFVKDAQHYGRQLPHDIKVTNSGYHGPYVGADHQTPINLVQKDLPPHTNGYFSHRNVPGPPPSPFPSFLSYPASSMIGGPYTPNQQIHYTPQRSPYTTTASAPLIMPISRPSAESSPVEVKTSSASVNGENHAFKKPDEGNSRYYKTKPRKRQVHVPTPAPAAPVPTSIATTPVAPPPTDRLPQQPPVQQQPQHLKSPLQPTLNVNAILSEMDSFCKDRWMYFGVDEMKGNVSEDEYVLLRNRGELIPIQDVTLDDFQKVTRNTGNDLRAVTVKNISENRESGTVLYALVHSNQEEVGVLEVEAERPLFAFGRGWTSYLPDRTRDRCKGLNCGKINEGDVVLIMSPKDRKRASAVSRIESTASKNRFQKATDLKKNHTSDSYHEFTNSNNNNNNNNNVSIATAAATVAANRNAAKRPFNENDSNNNESAAATAKRKRSAEEANKRRYSDSYLEKKF